MGMRRRWEIQGTETNNKNSDARKFAKAFLVHRDFSSIILFNRLYFMCFFSFELLLLQLYYFLIYFFLYTQRGICTVRCSVNVFVYSFLISTRSIILHTKARLIVISPLRERTLHHVLYSLFQLRSVIWFSLGLFYRPLLRPSDALYTYEYTWYESL